MGEMDKKPREDEDLIFAEMVNRHHDEVRAKHYDEARQEIERTYLKQAHPTSTQISDIKHKSIGGEKKQSSNIKKKPVPVKLVALALALALGIATYTTITKSVSFVKENTVEKTYYSLSVILDHSDGYNCGIVDLNTHRNYNNTYRYDNDAIADDIYELSTKIPEYTRNIISSVVYEMGPNADNAYNNMDKVYYNLVNIAESNPESALAQEIGNAKNMNEYMTNLGCTNKEEYTKMMIDDTYSKTDQIKSAIESYNNKDQGRSH